MARLWKNEKNGIGKNGEFVPFFRAPKSAAANADAWTGDAPPTTALLLLLPSHAAHALRIPQEAAAAAAAVAAAVAARGTWTA